MQKLKTSRGNKECWIIMEPASDDHLSSPKCFCDDQKLCCVFIQPNNSYSPHSKQDLDNLSKNDNFFHFSSTSLSLSFYLFHSLPFSLVPSQTLLISRRSTEDWYMMSFIGVSGETNSLTARFVQIVWTNPLWALHKFSVKIVLNFSQLLLHKI